MPVLCLDTLENKVADRISDGDEEGVGGKEKKLLHLCVHV